jgi:hypothetical protein
VIEISVRPTLGVRPRYATDQFIQARQYYKGTYGAMEDYG